MDSKRFPIGSNWGGLLPREEWANDFLEMHKAGMNALRLPLGFPGRRGPRIRYWEDVDYIFDEASKNDLGLLVSLITIILPKHFFEKYPDIRFIDIDGQPFPRDIEDLTWPQACFNHPGYRSEIESFFETVINRYKDRASILAWTVHNEPCNPWGGTGCYCHHTIAEFREWIEKRYEADLDELNRLWEADFPDWSQVEPPHIWPHAGGNATAWLDWMTFGEWNVTNFIHWEADLVRKHDSTRMVGTNTMGGMLLPITTAQSEKELAKGLDFIGIDWYPSWILGRRNGEKGQMEKHSAAKLDVTRWATGDKLPIVMEVQAGPNAESIWFGADEMRIEAWQTIAHGMKGLYYYRWDPLISGAEPWVHHMRTLEGEITDRVDEVGRLSKHLGSMLDVIERSDPITSPVAIFYSRPSKTMAQADNLFDPQYKQAIMGTYRVFIDNHYAVDWIDGEEVLAGKLSQYKVLALPFVTCLDEKVAAAIKAYVAAGGVVIAEPFCAARDERGVPYDVTPGAGLAELFGVQAVDTVKYHYWLVAHALEMQAAGTAVTGVKDGAKFWLCGLREVVEVTSASAQVLAEFADYEPLQKQSPAVVVNPYGQGHAVYMAAGLGEAYTKMETPYLLQMVGGLMDWIGIERVVTVEGLSEDASKALDIMVLDSEGGEERTVIVINHAEMPAEATLRIKVTPKDRMEVRELVRFQSLDASLEDDRLVMSVTLPARDATVLNVYHLQ